MGPIRQALRQRGLRRLLGAGLISMTGDWVLRIGLAYRVYVLTGSTLASAAVMLASFVPQFLLGSVAGVFVDRWNRTRTMVVCNLLLAVGLLPLLAVHSSGRVWVVYAVMAWEGVVQQFFSPAEQAMLPALVADDHLVTANALNGQSNDVSRLLGGAVGGLVVASGGIVGVALVDCVSFLLSAALVARITPTGSPRSTGIPAAATKQRLRPRLLELATDWRSGLSLAARQPVLRVVFVFILVSSTGEGIMATLFAPFVHTELHGSGKAYGLIVAVQAVGGLAGGFVAAAVGTKVSPARMFGWAAVVFGFIDLATFLYPLAWVTIWPAAAGMVVVGVPGALLLAGAMTLLQRNTVDSHRGRIFGALNAIEGVAVVAGTLAAGFLGTSIGIIPVLAAQGVGYALAGTYVLVALRSDPSPAVAPTPRLISAG